MSKLRDDVNSLVENFIKGCELIFKDIKDEKERCEGETKKAKDYQDTLKQQEIENKDRLKAGLNKADDEKERWRKLCTEVNEEISKTTKLNNELTKKDNEKSEQLKMIKAERAAISKELEKQVNKTKTYDLKIASLGKDSQANNDRERELNERDRKTTAKEKANNAREEKLIERERVCGERETTATSREKKIALEYTKLKL